MLQCLVSGKLSAGGRLVLLLLTVQKILWKLYLFQLNFTIVTASILPAINAFISLQKHISGRINARTKRKMCWAYHNEYAFLLIWAQRTKVNTQEAVLLYNNCVFPVDFICQKTFTCTQEVNESYVGSSLVWMQWVRLCPHILRKTDISHTFFEEILF